MSTDYRALCAELVDAIGSLVGGVKCGHYQQQDMWKCREIFDRARAALSQPEPVVPTDEELDEFAVFWWGSDTDERTVTDVIECCSMTAYARAVIARWGTPANNAGGTH